MSTGGDLLLLDINEDGLKETRSMLKGGHVIIRQVDLTKKIRSKRVFGKIEINYSVGNMMEWFIVQGYLPLFHFVY